MNPRPSATSKKPGQRRRATDAVRGRVRAHDPFELIRWLALSQPDPRKALAELVQNSLDAGAARIRVTRMREKGIACLRILDDGAGVIPEMDRADALHYIATHIGHSRKRQLSPQERLQLMTQGQYGIGLLGFWSLGQRLEIRSSFPGQRPMRLVLHRDDPEFEIEPLRGRLPLDERRTEVVVLGLHREAMNVLAARRAADYLASELRGQLLGREVELLVEDRIARGLAQKLITVRPPRFLGDRLPLPEQFDVPDHGTARLEIYLAADDGNGGPPHAIAVYSAGTLVAESFQQLGALGLDRAPWTDTRLTGMVDFPGFRVAPGSRRGVLADEAASAFVRGLEGIEPMVAGVLENIERQRTEKIDRTLVRDLQRAFRDFYRQKPRYSMLPVNDPRDAGTVPNGHATKLDPGAAYLDRSVLEDARPSEPLSEPSEMQSLLPPGPLAAVRLVPARVQVQVEGTKTVRAFALDAAGGRIESDVRFEWSLQGEVGVLVEGSAGEVASGRMEFLAGDLPGRGVLAVTAHAGGLSAVAEAVVEVVEDLATRSDEGIPKPEFVSQPGAAWRSRMQDETWQVNSGHRDFLEVADRPPLKLRYLAILFAKEIVLRSHHDPRFEQPFEQVVEVFAYADRKLASRIRRAARHSEDRTLDEPGTTSSPG